MQYNQKQPFASENHLQYATAAAASSEAGRSRSAMTQHYPTTSAAVAV